MTAAMGQSRTPSRRQGRGMNWLQRHVRPEQVREFSLLLLIIVRCCSSARRSTTTTAPRTFNRIASSVAIIAIVAVGQTLVVLTRNIDLSVGSIVGCTAYFVGTLIAANNDLHPLVAFSSRSGSARLMGAVNGVLVAWGRVPSIIVTLGTLAIYRGVLVDIPAPRPSPPTACRRG